MKYFVVSDVHSFYFEMISSLMKAGYSKNDVSHMLIINGDLFDRGPDAIKMYEFIREIPKERRILIKGNHEQLILEAVKKERPDKHDINNGTIDTLLQLSETSRTKIDMFYEEYFLFAIEEDLGKISAANRLWRKIVNHERVKEVVKWLESDEWIEYYELDNLIITHAFIPLTVKDYDKNSETLTYNDVYEYNSNWRETSKEVWKDARWGNPWVMYQAGLFSEEEKRGKTLVVGHWKTDDFYKHLNGDHSNRADIYFSKGIIGLDGGVRKYQERYIYFCNVLVIEDGVLYDTFGDKLE